MAILTTGNTFASGDQVTAATLNSAVNDAEFASGAVDNTSTQLSGTSPQQIIVKDLGISTGKIATGAVTTDKINASAVTTAKIADSNVTKAKIENVANMKALGNVSGSAAAPAEVAILDEDNMASNSATSLATQQSIKAYADSKVDGTGAGSFTTLAASDDVNFDSGTLFVDASADSVGIGTVSPSNTLHIENTTSSGAYINYDGQSNTEFGLRVESNASGGNFESDFGTGGTALLDLYANSAVVSGGDLLVARTQSATPVLLVKGNGNVGINTASPAQLLDVNGQARIVGNLFVGTDDTTPNGMIEVYGGGTGQNEGGEIRLRTAADFDTTYNHYFIDAYQDDLRIGRASGSDITLTSDGYVGIGSTAPDKLLVVAGVGSEIVIDDTDSTDTPRLRFRESGSTSGSVSTDAGELIFDSGTTERMRIDSSGNVGIGDPSPSAPLTVTSTTGGVLLPRMTTTQMNAISSPANGEMIYNTTANKFYGYAGGAWVALH